MADELLGGWYLAALRNGRTLGLLVGPVPTQEAARIYHTEKTLKHALDAGITLDDGDDFGPVYIVSSRPYFGAVNAKFWVSFKHTPIDPVSLEHPAQYHVRQPNFGGG